MKLAILAGGQGSRLLEETRAKSKALVRIGDQPILWHLLKYYEAYGITDFVIALGYQGSSIREYVRGLGARRDAIVDGDREVLFPREEPSWTVELVETGLHTASGGRIKRLAPFVEGGPFMLTWCDGLADVDLARLRDYHLAHGRLATLTAIHPPPRFGRLTLDGDRVAAFHEKEVEQASWINGAFFVLDPGVLEYASGDDTDWEREVLPRLAADGELMAYRHEAFWQCMDTLPEAQLLSGLWEQGAAPWKVWE